MEGEKYNRHIRFGTDHGSFHEAMILLSSLTTTNEGEIPLTFLLVAALYLGQQIAAGLTARDNVSQLTHIAGGVVGSVLGFVMNRAGMNRRR